jgi:preprotein translocase subunit SecE
VQIKIRVLEKFKIYIREVYTELIEKTSWPSFKELQKDALVVLIASLIFSLLIFAMDGAFNKLMDVIYKL